MLRLDTPEQMADWAATHGGRSIGFVPTMGFLHRGHGSLMALLRPRVDLLVVSVYVNPLQFAPTEDLARYPRDPDGDAELCRAEHVDVLFMPAELYPDGFSTLVSVHGLTDGLDGFARPGHFDGVATVCARLFGITRATVAAFGEKDFQQLAVVRRMVRDLAVPVEIVPGPLVRDDDGVALSSRNVYLSPDERVRARTLSGALRAMEQAAEGGEDEIHTLVGQGKAVLDCDRLDYLEVVDAETLAPLERLGDRPARALVAGWFGRTRLIDNVHLGQEGA